MSMCVWGQGAQCSSLYGAFLNPSRSFNWISVCVCVCVCGVCACVHACELLYQLGRPVLCVVHRGIMALGEGRSSSVCCGIIQLCMDILSLSLSVFM